MSHLRFGAFLPPYHRITENPTLCLKQDLEMVERLEAMGYDEAWFGEHHSGGEEIYASPELVIAAAAQRTRRIRLGTGVNSLPYHNPLILADRIMQLHHMTEGRLVFGVGPGALVSDARMLAITPDRQRDMMEQALSCILKLFDGQTVTAKTDWFELVDARLQLRPYGGVPIEVCAASAASPSGPRAAGKFGVGLLMVAARMSALADHWRIGCEVAAEHGNAMDRSAWRISGYVHCAETREQAMKDVEYGIQAWLRYHQAIAPTPIVAPDGAEFVVQDMIDKGAAVIGTPDDCIAHIARLQDASGGFGCFLQTDHNWASFDRKMNSHDLVARYVMPKMQDSNAGRAGSLDWVIGQQQAFKTLNRGAIQAQIDRHQAETAAKAAANRDQAAGE